MGASQLEREFKEDDLFVVEFDGTFGCVVKILKKLAKYDIELDKFSFEEGLFGFKGTHNTSLFYIKKGDALFVSVDSGINHVLFVARDGGIIAHGQSRKRILQKEEE